MQILVLLIGFLLLHLLFFGLMKLNLKWLAVVPLKQGTQRTNVSENA